MSKLLDKNKTPNVKDIDEFYTAYINKINKIYQNYSDILDKYDIIIEDLNKIIKKATNNIDTLNDANLTNKAISNNIQESKAILKEIYKYIPLSVKRNYFYSNLDVFDYFGLSYKYESLSPMDYTLNNILVNKPHKIFKTVGFKGKSDDTIANDGYYFGNLYGHVKRFEMLNEPYYDYKNLKLINNTYPLEIEYTTKKNGGVDIECVLVISPSNPTEKIDIIKLSLLNGSSSYLTLDSVKYKKIGENAYQTIDKYNNIILYPSSDSTLCDLMLPFGIDNVEVIEISITQRGCDKLYIKDIYVDQYKLNYLEQLIIDTDYIIDKDNNIRWTPDYLNTNAGSICGDKIATYVSSEINRYAISIMHLGLYKANNISGGYAILAPLSLFSNTLSVELDVANNDVDLDKVEFYVSFDDAGTWFKIIPVSLYNNNGIYRYYIRKPSTNISLSDGMQILLNYQYTDNILIKIVFNDVSEKSITDFINLIYIREKTE